MRTCHSTAQSTSRLKEDKFKSLVVCVCMSSYVWRPTVECVETMKIKHVEKGEDRGQNDQNDIHNGKSIT